MKDTKLVIIALLSTTLIALELVWTRIFSAEFFYTFAFLILSLAIMGLGLGALALRLFPFFDRQNSLAIFLSLTGLMAFVSPILVFQIGLDFSMLFNSWLMVGKLVLNILLLSSAFFFGGISLALLFKKNHPDMPRLYMADLLGAGIGVLIAILVMNQFGTPVTTFLSSLPVLLATFLVSRRWLKILPLIILAISILPLSRSESLLEAERKERAPVIYKHWDAMAKIKIYDYGEDYRGINIDNAANTTVNHFDGNWDRPDSLKFGFNIVEYMINQFDSCTFLSLGAGGGQDVFQALQFGATEIHAVEVIPHINDLMFDGDLAEFSGYIYKDPRVKVITEDVRAYVRRFNKKFDIMYSFSSNSFAALASGAFALAENYIFTTEAFIDYWNALTDSGYLLMEHQFYMPRLVAEAMDALDRLGIEDVSSHIAVYKLPNMRRQMVLFSKKPLTTKFCNEAIGEQNSQDYGYMHLLFPAPDSLKNNLIDKIVRKGWETVADSANIDISPCTDNRPFTPQLGLWRNFQLTKLEQVRPHADFFGFPLSKIIIVIILTIMIVLIIPLNLLPYLLKGEKLKVVPWLYFFTIGMAFMMIEIILMQKYSLFIGPSVYSIVTILLALLIASGIGSRFSKYISNKVTFLAIVIWIALDISIFSQLIYLLGELTLVPRILITALLILPLGFFMGMPFPKGALKVGSLIDWGFAVNGAATVVGATLIVLVAFMYGFILALIVGALLYLLAFALISIDTSW